MYSRRQSPQKRKKNCNKTYNTARLILGPIGFFTVFLFQEPLLNIHINSMKHEYKRKVACDFFRLTAFYATHEACRENTVHFPVSLCETSWAFMSEKERTWIISMSTRLLRFSPCESVCKCVIVVLKTPPVVGTNTEAVVADVCLCVCVCKMQKLYRCVDKM